MNKENADSPAEDFDREEDMLDDLLTYRQVPPLSPEGIREIIAELEAPPKDTPERRAMFDRARRMNFLVQQVLEQEARARRK